MWILNVDNLFIFEYQNSEKNTAFRAVNFYRACGHKVTLRYKPIERKAKVFKH